MFYFKLSVLIMMERSRNSLFCAVSEIGMISYGGT